MLSDHADVEQRYRSYGNVFVSDILTNNCNYLNRGMDRWMDVYFNVKPLLVPLKHSNLLL